MSEYYLPEARAERVHQLFTRIAPRYDLINDLQSFGLHRYWKRRLVEMSKVAPREKVLDVCTGTGDLALLFAEKAAQVMGFDFAGAMLRIGRQRDRQGTVQFARGDALKMPFPDETFDIVTIGYGLRNLADFQQGLAELRRVTRKGGRILILDFGKPENPLWRALYFLYLRLAVPIFGLLFCGDAGAYVYILKSLRNYPAQRGVDAMLKELGCKNVRIHNFLGGVMSINYGERG